MTRRELTRRRGRAAPVNARFPPIDVRVEIVESPDGMERLERVLLAMLDTPIESGDGG